MAKIAIIGSGFSGLSAAAYLSKAGHEVIVFEKNAEPGGRARQITTGNGYLFDMGPSWYWMPDVFERFFADFDSRVEDLYQLHLLDPGFDIVFPERYTMQVPADMDKLNNLFESIEPGAGNKLKLFLKEAKYKYETGMENLVYMPGLSVSEFFDTAVLKGALRLQIFSSFSKHVRSYFSDPRLVALMEFPVLFLGAMPKDTPALYSLMNYAGLALGTWYPQGGFGIVIQAMVDIASRQGTTFRMNSPVEQIFIENGRASAVMVNGIRENVDAVIASSDYHHTEQELLPEAYRNYTPGYWDKKVFAPSCLIYYLGISKKLPNLNHHTLFFEEDLDAHAQQIYKKPEWPDKPLFYVCCPSKTDASVAPAGHENLFLLMPLAPGLQDDEAHREQYFNLMLSRLERQTGEQIASFIDYKKSYCVTDFIHDYNSYKGNAYGLANTLMQTAILKPSIRNKKVPNLFYAGQLTVPGPGVPPSLISGKIAAQQVIKQFKNKVHERAL